MLRLSYVIAFAYLGICAAFLLGRPRPVPAVTRTHEARHAAPVAATGSAAGWFAAIRSRCNAVEAEVALSGSPPPPGAEGASYRSACYALAGKMDRAKEVIDALPEGRRHHAAGIVFGIVHPVADAGDDESAGPMMRLVLEYQPENFMALYHAGMSEYAVGDHALARRHLEQFLEIYKANDGWNRNAREVLRRPEMSAGER